MRKALGGDMEALKEKGYDQYTGTVAMPDVYGDTFAKEEAKSRDIDRSMSLKLKYIIFSGIISFMLIILMVLGYTKMVSINSDVRIIQNENEELKLAIDALKVEIKPYVAKDRIENIASKRLGMVYPTENNIVKLESTTNQKAVAVEAPKENLDKKNSLLSFIGKILR